MMNRSFVVAALLLAGQALPASAQLRYMEGAGSYSEFSSPGVPTVPISASERSAEDLVRLFHSLCVVPGFSADATMAAVNASEWQAKQQDIKVPFDKPEYAEPVRQWSGDGMVLSLVTQTLGPPTGSRFRIGGPQCSLITGGAKQTDTAITEALGALAGGSPSNIAEQVKNGKLNKRYRPLWTVSIADHGTVEVGFTLFEPRKGRPEGLLVLSVLPPKTAR